MEMAIQSSAPDGTLNVDKAIRMSGKRQMAYMLLVHYRQRTLR